MLEPNYNLNDVVTIKTATGEEIIGYFVNKDNSHIVLRKPIVPVPTGDGKIGFAPYLMTSDYMNVGNGEIQFARAMIVTMTKTSKQFADAYSQQVSGIDRSAEKQPGLIL